MADVKTAMLEDITAWDTASYWQQAGGSWRTAVKRGENSECNAANACWSVGYQSNIIVFRTKIKLVVGNDLIIGQANKLIVKIKSANSDTKPTYARAFLSKIDYAESDPSFTSKNKISRSECYKDLQKTKFKYEMYPWGTDCYFIFDEFSEPLKAGETYYIYIHVFDDDKVSDETNPTNKRFGLITIYNKKDYLDISLNYIEYTKCSPPSSITSTEQIYKDGTIRVSWSGARNGTQNAISKYRIFYRIGDNPTTSSNYIDTSDANKTEITIANDTIKAIKGQKVYFKIQALGSVSGYNSDISTANVYTSVVNSAPTKPSATLGGNALSGISDTEVEITVTSFKTSTDIDGDTLSYYYQVLDKKPSTNPTSGWSAAITTDTFKAKMSRKKPVLAIKVSDGTANVYEYFNKAVNPELKFSGDVSVSGEQYSMLGITDANATEKLSISASFSKKTNGTVQLQFGSGASYQDWKTFQNVDKINYVNESIKGFDNANRGKKINVRVVLNDGIDSVQANASPALYYLASLPNILSVTAAHEASEFTGYGADVDEDIKINVNSTKLGTKINFTGIIEKLGDMNIPLTKVEFFAKTDNTEVPLGSTITSPSNDMLNNITISRVLTLPTNFEYDKNYQIGMRIYDAANSNYQLTTNSFSRLDKPTFSTMPTITPENWNIYGSNDFVLTFQNLDTQNTGINTYSLYVSIDDAQKEICSFNRYPGGFIDVNGNTGYGSVSVSLDTLRLNIPQTKIWDFFKNFGIPTNKNNVKVKYILKVKNGVGVLSESVITESDYYIITRAETTWNGTFLVARGYCVDKDESTGEFVYPNNDIAERERIINPKECLRVIFDNLPSSPNSQSFDGSKDTSSDTQGVKIFDKIVLQYVASDSSNFPTGDVTWMDLGTSDIIPAKLAAQKDNDNKYYYDLTLPKLAVGAEGKKIYFRAKVTVSGGSADQVKIIDMDKEANTLIYGRTEPPTFRLSYIKSNNNSVFFEFNKDPKVNLDFGGLEKGFDNFARDGAGGYYVLNIKYGTSLDQISNFEKDFTFNGDLSRLLEEQELILDEDFNLGSKLYYQASLTVYPNGKDGGYSKVLTLNEAEVFYLGGPTVQVRKHLIGVNTDEELLKEYPDGVLVVANYNDQDKIIFRQLKDDQEIILDISKKEIHGIIIDGGSW